MRLYGQSNGAGNPNYAEPQMVHIYDDLESTVVNGSIGAVEHRQSHVQQVPQVQQQQQPQPAMRSTTMSNVSANALMSTTPVARTLWAKELDDPSRVSIESVIGRGEYCDRSYLCSHQLDMLFSGVPFCPASFRLL